MENESNILAGSETQSAPGDLSGETNPPADEFITDPTAQWEDFGDQPRESGEQTEAKPDGDDASKAGSAPAPDETEEEKAINAELQAVPESGRFRAMRSMLVGAQKQAKELEAELETARGVMFRPTVPAEEFSSTGRAKEFLDDIAKNHPAYYAPIVQDMIRTELTPERLQAGLIPEPTFNALASVFTSHWLPDFLSKTFGVGVDEFSQMIERHRTAADPSVNRGQPTGLSPQELTDLGLNPDADTDKPIIAALTAERQRAAGVTSEVAQLRQMVTKLTEAQTGTVKQREESAQAERVAAFEARLSADRQSLLDQHLKRIPRDAQGNIVKGYEHLPGQIADRVELTLGRNPDYQAKRGHAAKWFKQPGSVDTAMQLASGDLKGIYAHHKVEIAKIVAQELAPYAQLIRANGALETERRARTIPAGGTSPSNETEAGLRPINGRRPSLAERVKQQNV